MSNVAFLQYRVILDIDGRKGIHNFETWEAAQHYASYYRDSVGLTVEIQSRQIGPWATEPLS